MGSDTHPHFILTKKLIMTLGHSSQSIIISCQIFKKTNVAKSNNSDLDYIPSGPRDPSVNPTYTTSTLWVGADFLL